MSVDYEYTHPDAEADYYESLIKNCVSEYEDEENELRRLGKKFCPAVYECFMCWPPTMAGQTSTTSCPPEIDDQYNLSGGTATNYCGPDGNWTAITDDQCAHVLTSGEVCRCHHCDALTYLMMAGYSVSLIALVIAFFMIVGIRALRVKRNKIHANLLASFICLYTLSLFSIIFYFYVEPRPPVCQITLMLLSYFTLCNFAWMSLEGFYLYALVVLAFRIEPDKIRMWKYCLVGWGPPAILILCQCIAFIVQGSPEVETPVPQDYPDMNVTYEHASYPSYSYYYGNESHGDDEPNCWRPEGTPWQQYAFMIVPMLFLLAMNVFFLAMILKVLLPKIKTTGKNNMRNHLKMLKSAVVLVVLLGTVYIVFLIEPQIKNVTPLVKYIMSVINMTLQVTQGLAVAILYVFMNSDVQTKVSTEARRFSDRRLSSIKGLSIRPSNGNGGNSSVRTKVNRRLERLRLGNEARNRGSYAGDKTQTFSLSDSSSTDRQPNGTSQNGSTDHNSNGNIPQTLIEDNGDDEVFQETSLIQTEENLNENSNGYVKLREESISEYGEKPSEEAELLIDVRL